MDKRQYKREWARASRAEGGSAKVNDDKWNASDAGKERKRRYSTSPLGRYTRHRAHAKARGIEFSISFEEWWGIWETYWDQRGKGAGKMCMARLGDTGPYALGNVEIILFEQNARDIHTNIGG